jgi:PAS domain S-box-containing protein
VHPDDYERVVSTINKQIANSENNSFDAVRYRIITKNGKVFDVQDYGHLVTNEYGEEVYYVFLAKDIEE